MGMGNLSVLKKCFIPAFMYAQQKSIMAYTEKTQETLEICYESLS
jgi:hypothetical protein